MWRIIGKLTTTFLLFWHYFLLWLLTVYLFHYISQTAQLCQVVKVYGRSCPPRFVYLISGFVIHDWAQTHGFKRGNLSDNGAFQTSCRAPFFQCTKPGLGRNVFASPAVEELDISPIKCGNLITAMIRFRSSWSKSLQVKSLTCKYSTKGGVCVCVVSEITCCTHWPEWKPADSCA